MQSFSNHWKPLFDWILYKNNISDVEMGKLDCFLEIYDHFRLDARSMFQKRWDNKVLEKMCNAKKIYLVEDLTTN